LIDQIRAKARELLESGQVSCVIGYEEGTRGRVRPAFIYKPEDVDRLVWNERCIHNLVVYLRQFARPLKRGEEPPRVAILVKPCDSRSLNVLLQEKQVERERVYVIGLACEGMRVDGQLQERCQRCEDRIPLVYDLLVGEKPQTVGHEDYADVEELERMSPRERLDFWLRELDRCILCYACRQACPACYCSECVAEQLDPLWMGIAIDLPRKWFFHTMRAYHLAGRCAGCNACEQVCPMDIPLSLIYRKLVKEVETLFSYKAGLDAETPSPLATFEKGEELPL